MVTVRQAIERSLNIATARMARDVGVEADRGPGAAHRHPVAAADRAEPRARRRLGRADRDGARLRDLRERRRPPRAAVDRGSDRCRRAHAGAAQAALRARARRRHRLPGDLAARGRGRPRHGVGAARHRTARSDRRQDRDDRPRAGSLAGRLHARAGGGGLARLRRAAQPQDPERRGGAADLAALRSGHDGRPDPRPLPEAGQRRDGRDRSRDAGGGAQRLPRASDRVLPGGHHADQLLWRRQLPARRCPAAGWPTARPIARTTTAGEFFRWLRRHL